MMNSNASAWIEALRESHDDLVRRVRGLGDALGDQSYCTEWSIAQVLSHLGSGAEIALLVLESYLDGRPAPTPDDFPAVWNRWNSISPGEQAAQMVVWDRRYVCVLEAVTEQQLQAMDLNMFGMELDAVGVIGLRLSEHALHRWDVAVSEDGEAELLPSSVVLLLDRMPMMVAWTGKAENAGAPQTIGVRTSNPERRYLLNIAGTSKLTDWTDEEPEGVLELPAAAFIRLVYGRLDPGHTLANIRAEGVDLDPLRRVFPGF
jgi:uncharacterized protein (TIGR03083 family)